MKPLGMVLGGLRSLQLRFMVIVVIGALLFSSLAGALAYGIGRANALADSRRTLEGLADAVEKTIAIGTFAGDLVLLQEIADSLVRNKLVNAVKVLDANGIPLVASDRKDATASIGGAPAMSVERALVSPFDLAERVGRLVIVADGNHIVATASHEASMLGFMMAGQTALVALLLYAVTAWLVSRPIVRMARRLVDIQPGTEERLTMPVMHRHDELGMLIQGANELLDVNATALARERGLRAQVEAMEAQYRQIFESSSAGIFVLDGQGRLINGNPTVSKVVGLSLDQMRELRHDNFVQRVFGEPEQVRSMMERSMRLRETVYADLELVQLGNTRRWVHCLISVQRIDAALPAGSAPMVEGVIYDITDRKTAEQMARKRSEQDALTGLQNRASSDAGVDRLIAEALAGDGQLSLLCIDLDGFKQVNDTFGHHAGDQMLVACGARMKAAVRRSSDLVGRVGGDEFVVALRDVGPDDLLLVQTAAALLDALTQPVMLDDGTQIRVGASIGIACLPLHGDSRATLTQSADAAMYTVKRNGKNSYAMALTAPSVVAESARRVA